MIPASGRSEPTPSRSDLVYLAAAWKSKHQPFGLTAPDTTRQLFGVTKFLHRRQFCSPFG
jgi:hypothetical protein